jgi:hypothetical protein
MRGRHIGRFMHKASAANAGARFRDTQSSFSVIVTRATAECGIRIEKRLQGN